MQIKYLDTCLPDYFQGFGGEVLAVPLSDGILNGAVLDALNDEIEGWSGHLEGRQASDDDYAALHASANELFASADPSAIWNSHAGDESYAYFGISQE
jgi:hypothetical protein